MTTTNRHIHSFTVQRVSRRIHEPSEYLGRCGVMQLDLKLDTDQVVKHCLFTDPKVIWEFIFFAKSVGFDLENMTLMDIYNNAVGKTGKVETDETGSRVYRFVSIKEGR